MTRKKQKRQPSVDIVNLFQPEASGRLKAVKIHQIIFLLKKSYKVLSLFFFLYWLLDLTSDL